MKRKSALLDEGVGVPEVSVHSSASGEAGPGMEVATTPGSRTSNGW